MKRYNGGTKAVGGYYWNTRTWKIATIEDEQGVLDGGPEDRFIRIPLLLMVPLALLVSFVFVVFLPFIGFAMLAHALVLKVLSLREAAGRAFASTFSPALRPGEAYFAGKPEKPENKDPAAPEPLEDLKVEVDAARAEEDAQEPSRSHEKE